MTQDISNEVLMDGLYEMFTSALENYSNEQTSKLQLMRVASIWFALTASQNKAMLDSLREISTKLGEPYGGNESHH